MKSIYLNLIALLSLSSCLNQDKHELDIKPNLPTVGILVFEGFLGNEVMAPMDVFSKKDSQGATLFNLAILAKEKKIYTSEEGLHILPDMTLSNCPKLDVLIVPSSYHPEIQSADEELVQFIRRQSMQAEYVASHCAGAFLIGASGVAKNKKIVTYLGGGKDLKRAYPDLDVQDDSIISVTKDGKFISSNGSLMSYPASLDLLEIMTSPEHRQKVSEELLLERLQ
jgi:transcriptional regulator GlxA family with amidase domain